MSHIEILNPNNFRHVLALSILSGKSITITELRNSDDNTPIPECQTSLLKLIQKITNGSVINISEDETTLKFKPGTLIGGHIYHKCSLDRPISYFLEFLSYIVLLLKSPISLTLEGITNSPSDPSVDFINFSTINIMKKFGFDHVGIKITRRGYPPNGGGSVIFECKPIVSLKPVDLSQIGTFTKIQGVAYSMRTNPKIPSQLIEKVKERMSKITNHVSIDIDTRKSFQGGLSPGFGITLVAISDNKNIVCGEACIDPGNKDHTCIDEIAEKAYISLGDELLYTPSVDRPTASIVLIYMAIGSSSVSKCVLASPEDYIIELIRLIKKIMGISFKISMNTNSNSRLNNFVFSCCGMDLKNYNKHRS